MAAVAIYSTAFQCFKLSIDFPSSAGFLLLDRYFADQSSMLILFLLDNQCRNDRRLVSRIVSRYIAFVENRSLVFSSFLLSVELYHESQSNGHKTSHIWRKIHKLCRKVRKAKLKEIHATIQFFETLRPLHMIFHVQIISQAIRQDGSLSRERERYIRVARIVRQVCMRKVARQHRGAQSRAKSSINRAAHRALEERKQFTFRFPCHFVSSFEARIFAFRTLLISSYGILIAEGWSGEHAWEIAVKYN